MTRASQRWMDFRPCLGCGYDFATGEGERSCSLGECAYAPQELNIFCDDCRFDFLTMQGNSPCPDPMTCDHGVEPRSHVDNVRQWASSIRG